MGLREMSSNCHHIDGSVAGNSGRADAPGATASGGVPGATGGVEPFPEVGAVRYIKLGERGKWAGQALRDGILPFGYREVAHAACARGDWERVREQLVAMGRKNGSIGQGVRELKDFYELGEDTLWFTIADGHLWWTFADRVVVESQHGIDGPPRFRRCVSGWRNTGLTGAPLSSRKLSSALTSTANYQMTICAVKHADYLVRQIRGERDPLRMSFEARLADVAASAEEAIRRLDWKDFEILVDLIFRRGGWERIGELGGEQADVDLVLRQPITGETAWVQVKSRSTQAEFDNYLARFQRDGSCDRFFFVYHSAMTPIAPAPAPHLHLWSAAEVASAAMDAGLGRWLSDKLG